MRLINYFYITFYILLHWYLLFIFHFGCWLLPEKFSNYPKKLLCPTQGGCLYPPPRLGQGPRYLAEMQTTSSQPLMLLLAVVVSSAICQTELSYCASPSTQHIRLSGVQLCRPDSLDLLAAR